MNGDNHRKNRAAAKSDSFEPPRHGDTRKGGLNREIAENTELFKKLSDLCGLPVKRHGFLSCLRVFVVQLPLEKQKTRPVAGPRF
jgi:hypothetical protein